MSAHALDSSKEEPLRTDIRLLGRLLGDTVREQEGEAVFDIVERVRQTAIRFARDGDPAARAELASLLDPLPRDVTQSVVRAFSYFLQLANIAEDEHHIRRRRAHDLAGSPPREGSLIHALDALTTARVSPAAIADFFAHALVAPVLTAHPTEVQRQSLIRNHRDIARLLDQRERLRMTPEEEAENDLGLANAILTLWQSRMLRPVRLKVLDEVKNGISYFNETFFTELPRLYIQATQQLQKRFPDQRWALPPFFRVGSWIGGDRDGNPFVTADILREALRLQSAASAQPLPGGSARTGRRAAAFRSADQGHAGTAGPRRTLHRPFAATLGRALPPRPVRYLRAPGRHRPLPRPASSRCATRSATPSPTPRRTACAPTSRCSANSLKLNGSALLAGGRLRRLLRAVQVFGFHLAPIDLRQNSDVHARSVGRTAGQSRPLPGLRGALRRASAFSC